MYIWYHIFRCMSSIVSINGLDKKTLSGYVVFSVEKQKKGTYFPELAVICEIFN